MNAISKVAAGVVAGFLLLLLLTVIREAQKSTALTLHSTSNSLTINTQELLRTFAQLYPDLVRALENPNVVVLTPNLSPIPKEPRQPRKSVTEGEFLFDGVRPQDLPRMNPPRSPLGLLPAPPPPPSDLSR